MTGYYYVRPTDSLFVRGNLAFGDSGEHGASQMPPPPSLFAGAFRSALLGADATQMAAFLQHGRCADPALADCLGSAVQPGAFRVRWLSLAGQCATGVEPEAIVPLPADLVLLESGFARLEAHPTTQAIASSGDLPMRATLISAKQEKARTGAYLRESGLRRHLRGEQPEQSDGIAAGQIHAHDPRLGIGLASESRSADKGLIYTTEGYAFSPAGPSDFATTGFLVGIDGAEDVLTDEGLLRLGGDGRSATWRKVSFVPPQVDCETIRSSGRFRLMLQTPALFSAGWLPEGAQLEGGRVSLRGPGFNARLACAALGRREIISGWDLFNWSPKPAEAAAPAGSVYWFDEFDGDPDKLAAWVNNGMQADTAPNTPRRAEGFNLAMLALWKH